MLSHYKMEDRRKRADMIVLTPDNHKVCEGCDSIVTNAAIMCPSCHGYRFDQCSKRVIEQANLLGSRLPLSVGAQDYL